MKTIPAATVNGDEMSIDGIESVGDLLRHLGVEPRRVVVELNGTIYRRGEGLDAPLNSGDMVEIVHFVGGG